MGYAKTANWVEIAEKMSTEVGDWLVITLQD